MESEHFQMRNNNFFNNNNQNFKNALLERLQLISNKLISERNKEINNKRFNKNNIFLNNENYNNFGGENTNNNINKINNVQNNNNSMEIEEDYLSTQNTSFNTNYNNNNINQQQQNYDEITLNLCIEKILKLFSDDIDLYNLESLNNNHLSLCPICSFPLIAFNNVVVCVRGCIKLDIKTNKFNENYTLENFVDDYKSILRTHPYCGGNVTFLDFEDENRLEIYCSKCFNNLF